MNEKERVSSLTREFLEQLKDLKEVKRVVILVASEDDLFEVGFGCLACCAEIAAQFTEEHINEVHEIDKEIRH